MKQAYILAHKHLGAVADITMYDKKMSMVANSS